MSAGELGQLAGELGEMISEELAHSSDKLATLEDVAPLLDLFLKVHRQSDHYLPFRYKKQA